MKNRNKKVSFNLKLQSLSALAVSLVFTIGASSFSAAGNSASTVHNLSGAERGSVHTLINEPNGVQWVYLGDSSNVTSASVLMSALPVNPFTYIPDIDNRMQTFGQCVRMNLGEAYEIINWWGMNSSLNQEGDIYDWNQPYFDADPNPSGGDLASWESSHINATSPGTLRTGFSKVRCFLPSQAHLQTYLVNGLIPYPAQFQVPEVIWTATPGSTHGTQVALNLNTRSFQNQGILSDCAAYAMIYVWKDNQIWENK